MTAPNADILELTELQQRTLDSKGRYARFVDPRTRETYFLVPTVRFETVEAALREEDEMDAVCRIGTRNAVAWVEEEP